MIIFSLPYGVAESFVFIKNNSFKTYAGPHADTWAQCYKTFYHGNLLPFHGHTVILCYKAKLPW